MKNPIMKFRKKKGMSISAFAKKINSNTMTVGNVETRGVLNPEEIVRKIGLAFPDVNEGQLLRDYRKWEEEINNENKTA